MGFSNAINNLLREQSVTNSATNYVVQEDDVIINITNTAAARTVTLPAPSSTNVGKFFIVKDTSGGAATNNITVSGASGNIDGAANATININYGFLEVYSDGSNYFIYSKVSTGSSPSIPSRTYIASAFSSSTHDTWESTGLSIVVPAGTYRLKYNCNGFIANNLGRSSMVSEIRLWNITESSEVLNSIRALSSVDSSGTPDNPIIQGCGSCSFDLRITPSVSTTYRVEARKRTTGGSPSEILDHEVLIGSFIEYRSDAF